MSKLTASMFFHELNSPHHTASESVFPGKHLFEDPQKQIEEQLNQCESFFIQSIEEIIKEWKHGKMKQYKKILSNIDVSLRKNISPVICEQIGIQRQHLQEIMNEVERSLIKSKQQSTKDKIVTQDQDKTIHMAKNKERTCSSSFKPRSISNDSHPRRKLSKGSFFAQARKVAPGQSKGNNCMIPTTSTAGFKYNKGQSKIKKTKRKQQKCFEALEKCNSNTSPSNFMLSYMNSKDALKNNDQNIIERVRMNNYLSHERPNIESQCLSKTNAASPYIQDNQFSNESQTYQKLMVDFQEKISKKLDDLMNKYTKIQEKLQGHQQEKQQKYTLKISQKLEKQRQNTVSIQESLNQNNDSLLKLPQASMVSLKHLNNKQSLNQTKINNSSKNDSLYEQTKIKQDTAKKGGPKSIEINNKVVKNKVKIIQNSSQSLQEIQICKQKPTSASFNHEQAIKQQNQERKRLEQVSAKKKALQSDKYYFEEVIMDFNGMTQTNKIPITNQLLYIILMNYESFCKSHSLQQKEEIMSLQTKKLQNINKQHLALLEKMEKIMDSKAEKLKKQRMLKYFSKYIKVALTYDQKSNLIVRCEEPITECDLKAKFQQLKLQVSQA